MRAARMYHDCLMLQGVTLQTPVTAVWMQLHLGVLSAYTPNASLAG